MKTKIIGCGTLIAGDDGIGVNVVQQLKQMGLPSHVEVLEGGTDPCHLLELLRNTERVILVDAIIGAGNPGEIFVLSPQQIELESLATVSMHQFTLAQVLQLGHQLFPEEMPKSMIIVGIEAETIEPYISCLSRAVELAIPGAIDVILKLCTPTTNTFL